MLELASRLADELESGWSSLARPSQLPPPGDWIIWLILAGRGFGKTRAGSEFVRSQVEFGNAKSVAIVGATAADTRDVCIEGPSGILAISPDWNRPTYEPSKRRLSWASGATATMYSAEEADRLRGANHSLAWCDELASWSNQQATWDNLMMTLRAGVAPRCIISSKHSASSSCRPNLVPSYLRTMDAKKLPAKLARFSYVLPPVITTSCPRRSISTAYSALAS
jgi:phage terminase large subunit-like protein